MSLAAIDRLGRCRKISIAAKANLDEDETVTVAHYQVYFTEAGAKIAPDKLESRPLEISKRLLLSPSAY